MLEKRKISKSNRKPLANLKTTETFKGVNRNTPVKRSLKIQPLHLGGTFKVHNGKSTIEIPINEGMLGHKFGEFVFTRAKNEYKRRKKKKKQKKKLKKKN